MTPRRLVNLRGAAGLDDIVEEKSGTLRIGSLVTLVRLAENPIVRQRYTALAEAAGASASPRSDMWRHWAGICCKDRVAGISVRRITIAHAKGANRASPLLARTNTMRYLINRAAPSCILRPQRRPWWRLAPGLSW